MEGRGEILGYRDIKSGCCRCLGHMWGHVEEQQLSGVLEVPYCTGYIFSPELPLLVYEKVGFSYGTSYRLVQYSVIVMYLQFFQILQAFERPGLYTGNLVVLEVSGKYKKINVIKHYSPITDCLLTHAAISKYLI